MTPNPKAAQQTLTDEQIKLINDFLTEVDEWPDGVADRMACNRDAVEKLKNTYYFSNNILDWRKDGVPEQYCILGEQLNAELEKMLDQPTG